MLERGHGQRAENRHATTAGTATGVSASAAEQHAREVAQTARATRRARPPATKQHAGQITQTAALCATCTASTAKRTGRHVEQTAEAATAHCIRLRVLLRTTLAAEQAAKHLFEPAHAAEAL